MKDFTALIPLQEHFSPLFSFTALYTTSAGRYCVSVIDQTNASFFFTMEQRADNSWKIIDAPKVPEWIIELEGDLQEAIREKINK